jgi:hypothetical protein
MFGGDDDEYKRDGGSLEDQFAVLLDFFAYFSKLTASRREQHTGDLASAIANGSIDGEPLSDVDTASYYVIVASAGHDTTKDAISGGMRALIDNRAELERHVGALRDRVDGHRARAARAQQRRRGIEQARPRSSGPRVESLARHRSPRIRTGNKDHWSCTKTDSLKTISLKQRGAHLRHPRPVRPGYRPKPSHHRRTVQHAQTRDRLPVPRAGVAAARHRATKSGPLRQRLLGTGSRRQVVAPRPATGAKRR